MLVTDALLVSCMGMGALMWSHLQVAEMQQKRGSHASTVAFDQVFALGGWDANAFLVC